MKSVIFCCKEMVMSIKVLNYLLSCGTYQVKAVLISGSANELLRICAENNIPTFTAEKAKALIAFSGNEKVDLLLSFGYRKKLSPEVINLARYAVNCHPAPLPEYKGVCVSCFAILNGEHEWGVTFHLIDNDFDTGDIIYTKRFPINSDALTGGELSTITWNCCYEELKKLLVDFYENGFFHGKKQMKGGNYYSQKMLDAQKEINITDSSELVDRKIRALWFPPYQGAYINIGGKSFSLVNDAVMSRFYNVKLGGGQTSR